MIKKQFLKFVSVGLTSTVINYLVFYTLYSFFNSNYLFSSGTGYIVGVYAGFALNKGWTFEVEDNSIYFLVKYFITYTISLIISLILLRFFVITLGIMVEWANVIVIGFTTLANFIGTKYWVFKR